VKFVDEYRDPALAKKLLAAIRDEATKPWVLMEVCGGQTHALVRSGIDELLEGCLEVVHGPGCPVCVTPLELIDKAHAIAQKKDVIFTSFGDMLRVPGSRGDLLSCRSRGADVRVVYSPFDALTLARANPSREVVFFAVGFETTAPATALALQQARKLGVGNFSALSAHVLVPPAIEAIVDRPGSRIQGFLGPGHVCAVVGLSPYRTISRRYGVPIVVTGFEPVDLLDGLLRAVRQLESSRHEVENAYARVVAEEGNVSALRLLDEVFETIDRAWRGFGNIPKSGYGLSSDYHAFDAARKFRVESLTTKEDPLCLSGLVLSGKVKPTDCPAFGRECTPETPLGATMVSAEGACAAFFACGRQRSDASAP
jgi:hydrogenase expression/formation protein HypD